MPCPRGIHPIPHVSISVVPEIRNDHQIYLYAHCAQERMEFEWNEAKNQRNIAKHGIGFERATKIFADFHVTREDRRYSYGEIREVTIGLLEGRVVVVIVHTNRNGRTRIISARRANFKERIQYNGEIQKRTQT